MSGDENSVVSAQSAQPIATLDRYATTDRGRWVRLINVERSWAWDVASERDAKALAALADPNKHAVDGLGTHELVEMTSRVRNYVGCLGELSVAKFFGVSWSSASSSWADDDDVCGIQVRATIYSNGALRCWLKDEGPLILAVVYHGGVVRLAGWLAAERMRERRAWGACWFAPQANLLPMEDFVVPAGLPPYELPYGRRA